MDSIYAFYNVFSWWITIWVFLYTIKVCPIEPYVAIMLTLAWDIFALLFMDGISPTAKTPEQKWVLHFRTLLIALGHWVPIFTLPMIINKQSAMFLIALGMIYMLLLNVQGLTVFDVYDIKYISMREITTFEELFSLRFHNYFFTVACLFTTFYSGYYLIRYPYKDSIVRKYLK